MDPVIASYILFIVITIAGCFASAVFGFGTALFVLAVGSHILPVKETIGLTTVLLTALTVTRTIILGRHIDWKIVAILSVTSLPFAYIGAQLLALVPAEGIKRMLGAMILTYIFLNRAGRLPQFNIGTFGLLAGSAVYGMLSGLLGSGNIVKVIMLREMSLSREAFLGALAATSVAVNVMKVGSYWQSGFISGAHIWPMFALILGAILSVFVGQTVITRLHEKAYETGIQVLLFISATALLL